MCLRDNSYKKFVLLLRTLFHRPTYYYGIIKQLNGRALMAQRWSMVAKVQREIYQVINGHKLLGPWLNLVTWRKRCNSQEPCQMWSQIDLLITYNLPGHILLWKCPNWSHNLNFWRSPMATYWPASYAAGKNEAKSAEKWTTNKGVKGSCKSVYFYQYGHIQQ